MARANENNIKEYLLGRLSDVEEEQVELHLLTDPGFAEEYDIVVNEITDDYVNGKFEGEDLKQVEEHFFKSPERRKKLKFALALKQRKSEMATIQGRKQKSYRPYLAIAASLLLVVGGFFIWRALSSRNEVDKGLAALQSAFRDERPLEARISNLNYAPYITTRGPGSGKIDENELNLAELTLRQELKNRPTPAVHHALGKVFLAKKDFDRAIQEFDEALKGDLTNAQLYNDLGGAWLEKGKIERFKARDNPTGPNTGKGMENLVRSLENLNRARELNPRLWEPLFNSALVHQEMGLWPQAEEAWRTYLEKDPSSKWADEARQHLANLEERKKTRSMNKSGLVPEFLTAYRSRNDSRALELLSTNTEAIAGQLMWWQLAEAFLDESANLDREQVDYSQVLSYAGSLQVQNAGDRFLSELASFYKRTTRTQQVELASAHSMINEAHALLSKSQVTEALDLYRKAKALFDKTGDEGESLFAVYWIGYSHYRQSQLKESEAILQELAKRCRARNYLSLLEKALTMIANMQSEFGDYSKSIATYIQSLEISRRTGDVYNLQKNLSSLANGYRSLGKRQASFAHIELCLESSKAYWPGARQMYRNYYTTAAVLNSFGHHAAAAEYQKAALTLALDESDPVLQNQSYVALAAITSKMRDYPEAVKYANLGYTAAGRMSEHTRLAPAADALLHLGHIYRQTGDYGKALSYYDEAIKSYKDIKQFALLYEAHKGRLLNYIAQHHDAKAKEELQVVLTLFEDHRGKILEERSRNSFFDMEQGVYDVAIDFEFSRTRDYQKAFNYSEVSRARSLLDLINTGAKATGKEDPDLIIPSVREPMRLDAIRERMPEQTQILQYAVLEDKLLTWVISKANFETVEQKIDAGSLTEKIIGFSEALASGAGSENEECRRAGIELYEILIKPVESLLERDKQIYVVPDKILNSLAFNALIVPATGRYLVNDYLFAFAPSSNAFVLFSEVARKRAGKPDERLLSVGNPYFSADAFPDLPELPASGKEAAEISHYYKSASLLIGEQATKARVNAEMNHADVIHIASHYVVNEQNPMLSRLLLTREPMSHASDEASNGVLQAYEISERKLPITRLVTLSACRTGVERYYHGEGMIGMSRTFLAAGVPTVVASLWPVASGPTADLMTDLHKHRKQGGLSTARALRQSQLDMLASKYPQPYYWASFVLIGGYATF